MTNRMIHTPGPILAASGTNTHLSQYWSTVITDRILNVSGWYENDQASSATASELDMQFDTAASGWTIGLPVQVPVFGQYNPQFLEWMDVNLGQPRRPTVQHLDRRVSL